MAADPLRSLMGIYDELGRQVATEADAAGVLQAVAAVTARSVPGADAVSITRRRRDQFETAAGTDNVAVQADIIQYELGDGPCVDAVGKEHVFHSPELAVDLLRITSQRTNRKLRDVAADVAETGALAMGPD